MERPTREAGRDVNRRERRSAEKRGRSPKETPDGSGVLPAAPVVAAAGKPGFLLRAVAKVLLAQWVLRRVNHPQVLGLLSEVARQTGRFDVVTQISKKSPTAQ